jgi:hypothetical protein
MVKGRKDIMRDDEFQNLIAEYEKEIRKLTACNEFIQKDNERIRMELLSSYPKRHYPNNPEFFKEEEFNI